MRRLRIAVLTALLVALASDAFAEDKDPPRAPGGAVPSGAAGAAIRPGQPEAPAPPPNIVMPKVTKYVEPVYPEAAFAAGLKADVDLKLSIDRTGHVKKADVVAPVGNGFDEAAQAAALQLEFEPATRDGKPIPVSILWRYTFAPKEVEKPREKAEPPKTGNLSGQVRLAAGGTPMAGVDVTVTGPKGDEHKTVTDPEGKWSFEGLEPAWFKIRVTLGGFQPVEGTEEVVAGEATEVNYQLTPEAQGVVVTVRGTRPPREVTRRTIERREMMRIPGTSGDALRSIQSLPGVARPPGLAGLLIVRGSAPQDTAVFVDGAAVPIVYHFGGLSSVIPTELLDRLDFYPGNFGAKYGEVMGGIVDVALRKPDTSCTGDYGAPVDKKGCFHGIAEVNAIDTRAVVQGPIAKNWSFVAAGRRSWVDAWAGPVLTSAGVGVTSLPVYYDYQAIVDAEPTPTSHFSARFFGSDDRLRVIINDPFAQDPGLSGNLTFGTAFYRAQGLYETSLTKNVDFYSMVAAGKNTLNIGLGPLKFDLDITLISARSELGFRLFRGVKLNAGLDFLLGPYDVFVRGPAPPRPGEADAGPFTTRPILQSHALGTAFRPAWYADAEIQPTRRSLIVPGVRLDFARDTGHADFSPRINARYDLIGGRAESDLPLEKRSLRTTLKGGVGYYYQPPQFQETNQVFGTPGLFSNKSIHYSVGVEQEFSRQIEMSVEGYYKNLTNLVSRTESLSSTFQYANQGVGSVYGMELLLKYKPDSRFFGWAAYTLSRSVRTDLPGQQEHLAQYDQTHILTILGSYRLGRGWEFGARYRLISGNLATPVAASVYAADAAAYTALSGNPFSQRLPAFNQLDIRVDKGWQFRTWRLSLYLELLNVYNNAAKEAINYNYNFTQSTYTTGLPFIPNLGIRGDI